MAITRPTIVTGSIVVEDIHINGTHPLVYYSWLINNDELLMNGSTVYSEEDPDA